MHSTHPSYSHEKAEFTNEMLVEVKRFMAQYPEGKQKSAILPILHIAQKKFGWISVEIQDYIAGLLHIQPIEVYEVATFYTMFHLHKVGKYVMEVCRTGPCMIVGAEDICKYLENKLGIKENETTADGIFTWRTVECLGACGYAPMMQVGDNYHEHLTKEKLDSLISQWANQN